MKINIQISIMRQLGMIALVTTLISSTSMCAPQPSHNHQHHQLQSQQQSAATTTNTNQAAKSALSSFLSRQTSASSLVPSSAGTTSTSTAKSSIGSGSTTAAAAGPSNKVPLSSASSSASSSSSSSPGSSQQPSSLSSVASDLSGSPSVVNLRDGATLDGSDQSEGSNVFDGKNPFADESLWQIPINLVRDSSASADTDASGRLSPMSNDDNMAKSATTEMSSADEHDDAMADSNGNEDGDEEGARGGLQRGDSSPSSSAPTVISASTTDLKTAAGYHHATPHHGYEGGDHHGHDAAHHDHYGKYFQYASVPYPYAWDFGYRRGNPYHTIERYEHGKGPHFQTKVKWSDKHGGYGVHVWDYNHDDHHSHHYGGGDHGHHGYDSHGPSHYGGHHHAAAAAAYYPGHH